MSWSLPWRRTAPADTHRWVVVDVETSGLDADRARLLAIAAVALNLDGPRPSLCAGDSFEIVIGQDEAPVDKANILLHGIGIGAQRQGVEPALALERFEAWLGRAPLIAFHAAFDETLIRRAMARFRGRQLSNPWLDLAQLAPLALPQVKARSLDDWLASQGLACAVRHQAAADAWATAELLLKLWPDIQRNGEPPSFERLQRRVAERRWLGSTP